MAAPKEEKKIYVGIILDFETSGLNCKDNAATQLAMQAVRMDTWEVVDRYVAYIKPYNKQTVEKKSKKLTAKNQLSFISDEEPMAYEQKALEYSGITMSMLNKMGVDVTEVAKDVIEFAKRNTLSEGKQTKPVIIGQNITFDIGFLQQIINYGGKELVKEFSKVFAGQNDFYGNFQPKYIDTIDLARLTFANDPEVNSYKLELICERLGIEIDDAHDADADVTATLNVVIVSSNRMRNGSGENYGANMQTQEKSRNHFKI